MDAEGVAFLGKVQKDRMCCGDLFAPLLTARCFNRTNDWDFGSTARALNQTGILTSLKWDRLCKIACLEIYRFCILSLVPRAAIAVIDNVITGKWFY